MASLANILTVALFVVAPFLRPCTCHGFHLLCDCRAEQSAEDARPDSANRHESSEAG